MALSGSVATSAYTTDSGKQFKVVLNWSATQSVTDNTSEISWNLKVSTGSGGYIVVSELRVTIDGDEVYYRDNTNHTNGYNGTKLASGTKTLSHNTDGSKSMTIELEAGIYDWSINKSGSSTFTLDTIPRASTIGASDANIGSKSTIVVTRKSTAYTHSIAYKFGSLTGYVTESGGVSNTEVKYSTTNISWAIPTTFYEQIPNAKTGTCTLTIKTYSGSTQIGDAKTDTFIVTATQSACAPSVSGSVVDSNSATKALTGDERKLVWYYSTASCTITATAKNSATISSKKIGGTTVSGNTRSIAKVEVDSVSFYAKDSRGYEASTDVDFTLVPYVILTNNSSGQRTDPTSGNAKLTIKGDYFNGSFGSVSNALTIKYRFREVGGTYGSYTTVTPAISGNSYTVTKSLPGMDYKNSYEFEVVVSDKLATVTKVVTIMQGIPVFDWGENDFSFHVPVYLNGNKIFSSGNVEAYLPPHAKLLTSSDDLNSIKTNGWYYWLADSKPSNVPSVSGTSYMNTLRVWTNTGAVCYQECVDMTDSKHRGCAIQRIIYDSTAYDWEWVNPPMDAGVEYRTTERYNGKTVYAKLVNFGTLPSNTYKDVTLSSSTVTSVRIDGILNYTGESTYASLLSVSFVSSAQVLSTNIRITTNTTAATRWTAMVMVWYTKD